MRQRLRQLVTELLVARELRPAGSPRTAQTRVLASAFRFPRLGFPLFALLLQACADEPTKPPDVPLEGSIRFAYSGDISGIFEISGVAAAPTYAPFAYVNHATFGPHLVLAALRHRGSVKDVLVLSTGVPPGPGTFGLGQWSGNFNHGEPMSGPPTLTGDEYFFSLDSGSIVVTEFTGERVRGSFAATGGYARISRVPPLSRDTFTVVIADGTFDVPFVACCPY